MKPLPSAWGDTTVLEQIFANLIGNALNYLDPERPGVVEVGTKESEADGGMLTYYVKDNGLGIPQAYHQKVFHAFQRFQTSGRRSPCSIARRMRSNSSSSDQSSAAHSATIC